MTDTVPPEEGPDRLPADGADVVPGDVSLPQSVDPFEVPGAPRPRRPPGPAPAADVANDALNVFRGLLGMREEPDGSNCTPITHWYGPIGGAACFAWCDATVSFVLSSVGLATRFASCWFHQQALKDGTAGTWLGKPPVSQVAPGDLVFFGPSGSDHIGMVESLDVVANAVVSLEGNIGNACRREFRPMDGGGMRVFGFGRPHYGSGDPDAPPVVIAGTTGQSGVPVARVAMATLAVREPMVFGRTVRFAQASLKADGRDVEVDGEYGPLTGEGVRAFHRAHRIAGSETTVGAASWAGFLQVLLNAKGATLGVDGEIGPKTSQALWDFQGRAAIERDNVAGPQTFGALTA